MFCFYDDKRRMKGQKRRRNERWKREEEETWQGSKKIFGFKNNPVGNFCPATFSSVSHSTCCKRRTARRAEFEAQIFELSLRTRRASGEWLQHATPTTILSPLSSSASRSNTRTRAPNGSPQSCHSLSEISPKAQPSSSVATTSWGRKSWAAMSSPSKFKLRTQVKFSSLALNSWNAEEVSSKHFL